MNGELVSVWRKVKKKPNRSADCTCYQSVVWSSIVVGKEKNNVFISYRDRVTKVAPECFRKASGVAEQITWDISTRKKALCVNRHSTEKTFRGKNPCSTNPVNLLM